MESVTIEDRIEEAELFSANYFLGAKSVRVYNEEIRDGKRVRYSVEGRCHMWQVVVCRPMNEGDVYLPAGMDDDSPDFDGRVGRTMTFQVTLNVDNAEQPDFAENFQSVLQDAAEYENSGGNFITWLSEHDHQELTPDRLRELEGDFHEVARQYRELKEMFGDDLHAWLFETWWT